jgi:hypothetical protein
MQRAAKFMKSRIIAFLALFLFFHLAGKAGNIPKKFQQLLDSNDLQFRMPEGYRKVRTHENPDMYYNFAIKNKKKKLEIRYTVLPLGSLSDLYNKSRTDTSIKAVKADSVFGKTMLMVNMLNISDTIYRDIVAFDPASVKNEFGADWGGFAMSQPRTTFAKGYKYCVIVGIHKNNVADGFITYLFDDIAAVTDDIYGADFYCMQFRR